MRGFVGAVLLAVVVVGVALVFDVPPTRALQWGLLTVAGTAALGVIALLPVRRSPWPESSRPPVLIGWHALRTAESELRQAPRRRGTRRRPTRRPATGLPATRSDDEEG